MPKKDVFKGEQRKKALKAYADWSYLGSSSFSVIPNISLLKRKPRRKK